MSNADIQIKPNDYDTITLFDTHDITINRGENNDAEIVIHPCRIGKLTIRFAKEPYGCWITLANKTEKEIYLDCEDDWGNIQRMNPGDWFKEGENTEPADWHNRIGWGNDVDGHIEIVKVTLLDDTEIPLEDFKRDVADFTIYHEN